MDDASFFARSPRERNYFGWFASRLNARWYVDRGTAGTTPGMKPAVVVVLVLLYLPWCALIAVAIAGYALLWLLLWPVRLWARKTRRGYYAEPPA